MGVIVSRRRSAFERRAVPAAVGAVSLGVVLVGIYLVLAVAPSRAGTHCTHGASSIGPVFVRDGRIVGGDTTPHTEACLP
jgi:hypothetical protein